MVTLDAWSVAFCKISFKLHDESASITGRINGNMLLLHYEHGRLKVGNFSKIINIKKRQLRRVCIY